MTTVAIHQPNFFPWLGFFDKIARSDVFVLLDHVQFPKTGAGVWTNRVKLVIGGEARWVTAPIARNFHGVQMIREMEFQAGHPWRTKLFKSLLANYARARFFRETVEFLEPLILNPEGRLARYNGAAIIDIANRLGLPSERFRWSSDFALENRANEMLISLTHASGGDVYMCGGGAEEYQDDVAFAAEGIGVLYQHFQHPVYPQVGTKSFIAGLSVVDALMNVGVEGLRILLRID